MDLKETKKTSELIFDGEILHVYKDTAIIPGGEEYTRELIRHIGAVAIVALTDDGQVILERQFRYPVDREIIEIPAGKLDFKEENRLEAAKREFREETGYTAKEWVYIGDYVPAAAYSDEVISIYLAKGLSLGEQDLDEDEFLEVFTMPLKDAAKQCIDGEITDGKTIAGILRAFYFDEHPDIKEEGAHAVINNFSITYKESGLTDEVLDSLIELSKDWERENSCHGYRANTKDDIEGNRIFLGESEGQIIAYLFGSLQSSKKSSVMPEGTTYFEVEEIYVCPAFRSKGVGSALFEYMEKQVKDDAEYVILSTATKNWKNIFHFYIDELNMNFWNARLFKKI